MDWQLIQRGTSAQQRITLFLSLQQYRYAHSPQKAALALWKGHFGYDIGKRLFAEVEQLNGDVSFLQEPQVREYFNHLLKALALLQQHADNAHQRRS